MHIEKLSLKALTVSVLLVLGLLTIATGFVSESRYRQTAIEAQTRTVARILEVAGNAALAELESGGAQLATTAGAALGRQPGLDSYLAEAPAGTDNPALTALLAALLDTDRPGLKPVSASLLNSAGQPLLNAGQETIDNSVTERRDPQRPVGGFWLGDQGARYSILQPIGENPVRGYLALSFDSAYSLRSVATLTGLPLRIQAPGGDILFESGDWSSQPGTVHEITYRTARAGDAAVSLVALDDFADLYHATRETRTATIVAFVLLTGTALLVAIMILNRFLFKPLGAVIADMKRVADGDASATIGSRALKEFHVLANAFNAMTQQIRDIIERERQMAEDVKGKVELIQEVVAMAAEGDLTGQVMVYRDQDTISELATGIQQMLDSLNSLVTRIQQSGVQVTSSATEIAATARQQEATVNEQAATTN
jgi:HAMP domain-containing protein